MPADRLFHPKLGHSEKVSALSHLEFRVWAMYQLTADDYGVMRKSPVTLQAADDALAKEKPAAIMAALKRLVACGLLKEFTHQGRIYVYQKDWQNFQRVKHPRDTMQPLPSDDEIAACTSATRKLFVQHPSKKPSDSENDLGQISEILPQDIGNISEGDPQSLSESGSLARAHACEMANGYRLPANGFLEKKKSAVPPMDVWFVALKARYPEHRVTDDQKTQHAFVDQLTKFDGGVDAGWALMQANLELNVASHEWRMKGMVPWLYKYLAEGRWKGALPTAAPVADQLTAKTSRTLQAAADAVRRPA